MFEVSKCLQKSLTLILLLIFFLSLPVRYFVASSIQFIIALQSCVLYCWNANIDIQLDVVAPALKKRVVYVVSNVTTYVCSSSCKYCISNSRFFAFSLFIRIPKQDEMPRKEEIKRPTNKNCHECVFKLKG